MCGIVDVLQVLVRQEIYRKQGYAVQAEEEQLRVQNEALQAELNAPTQFKVSNSNRVNLLTFLSEETSCHHIGYSF